MSSLSQGAPAQSPHHPALTPIESARVVLGQSPRDIAMYLDIGAETLDWLETIFSTIEILHERGGSEIHIKRLAGIGKFVAGDISNLIGCEHEKVLASIKAAEGPEGGVK